MKNSADLGGCYPPRPSDSVDNTLLDLQNSSYPTHPHSIIAKYHMPPYLGRALEKPVHKKCCPSKTMPLNLCFFTRAFGEQIALSI